MACVLHPGDHFVLTLEWHTLNFLLAFQEEVNVTCTNGALRLADGLTEHEGRVEICYDNHWGGVCGNYWDSNEANVVCRQLGKIPIGKICELHSNNLYKSTVSNTKLMNFFV